MTDPDLATRVYIEPLTVEFVEKIIALERPDAIIPTLGGQTALNLALELDGKGVLSRYAVRMLGANPEVIRAAEDREAFRAILDKVGAGYAESRMVRTFEQGQAAAAELGFPLILRPNYTLGGGGGGVAYTLEEYEPMILRALKESPTSEVLVEASILGWKEFELEVMRDRAGTFVIVCSIENFDPCGVHTGDSITVAPQQTLSDLAYQAMRDEAKAIIDAIGLECGGANIQFAVHPDTGDRVVIEMNPRVSRSSALASKATGFPIAKIAALVAVGFRLDEIQNDITKTTPSCYEPALDYIVTKIPRFNFEKFAGTPDVLTTQMKSVGEVMAIGRTFQESLQKAVQALEGREEGFPVVAFDERKLSTPNSQRLNQIVQAFRSGLSIERVQELTQITPYFLEALFDLVEFEGALKRESVLTADLLLAAKRKGFSDRAIATMRKMSPDEVEGLRIKFGCLPGYAQVDTCAGEFSSETPYLYSSYWAARSSSPELRRTGDVVVVLGSGPNRIGQGIEFDYSCVRGVKRLRAEGHVVCMINSNPETVSTDYDTSNELYFEPLTVEHVREVMRFVSPVGFIAQLGGQTPIHLASRLVEKGQTLLGSSLDSIDLAEDRGRFGQVCKELQFEMPQNGMAGSLDEALLIAQRIGYPMICRPSYVLGGRRMEVVETEPELRSYFERHGTAIRPSEPCLIDQFLDGALEVDVDLVRGTDWIVVGGVIEHLEAAGVHSGDSMGVIPPQRLRDETLSRIERLSERLAERLGTVGHLNLQLAVKDDRIYMLEANPRASRSVPFLSKATGIPLVDLGIWAMLGRPRGQVQPSRYDWRKRPGVSVKGVVFPFRKFREADSILGPEMKSTGESMGRGETYAEALMKASIASHLLMPQKGEVFLSLRDKDKESMLPKVRQLVELGYRLSATFGTAEFLESHGLPVLPLKKVHEGRPHCVDRIRSGEVAMVINTTSGRRAVEASFDIRRSCIDFSIPCITESDAAEALVEALIQQKSREFHVSALPKML
jgi:carbamoyl-phosphate synthase large subunit